MKGPAHRDSTVIDETHNQTYSETFYDEPLLVLTALNTVMKATKKDLKSKQISFQTNFIDYPISRLLWLLEMLFTTILISIVCMTLANKHMVYIQYNM